MFIRISLIVAGLLIPHLTATELPDWKTDFWPEDDAWKQTEQHLRFNNGADPATIDPQIMTGFNDSRIAMALFEGLVTNDPVTLEPRPGVAQSWTISDDGLIYTFQLRDNAKWSNGQQLTAQDFLRSWRRALSKETASEYAYMLHPIKGAEAWNKNNNLDFAQTLGLRSDNPQHLEITLHQPCPWFLDLLAFPTLKPVPMDVIADHGSKWTDNGIILSNGPYQLREWKRRQHLILDKNLYYWDADFVKLTQITVFPYDNLETAHQLFLNGDLDWNPSVPPARIEEASKHPDYYAMPFLGTYFYRFNCSKAPFNDKRVRQALTMALNRRQITDEVLRGGQVPTTVFSPSIGDYKPADGLAFNPGAARSLLAEAGFDSTNPFPAFTIMYNNSEAHKQVAEAVQQQWRDNLGIKVSLQNMEWQAYLSSMSALDYDVCRSGWIGDYGDPNTFYSCMVTDGGNNRTGWSSAEYDELLKKSQAVLDTKERIKLFTRMEEIISKEELPLLPIYSYVTQGMLSERVLGIEHNIRAKHPFQYIWLED